MRAKDSRSLPSERYHADNILPESGNRTIAGFTPAASHNLKKSARFISRVPLIQLRIVDSACSILPAIVFAETPRALHSRRNRAPQSAKGDFFSTLEAYSTLRLRRDSVRIDSGPWMCDTYCIMAKPKRALREFRKSKDLTAAEVAKKLGIAESTLRSYENGTREIDGDTAVLIESRLGIPREDIRADLFRREAA